jgi:Ser/Thr protein kinase RdoA (MazF antagonist)
MTTDTPRTDALIEAIGRYGASIAVAGTHADLAPPPYLVDAWNDIEKLERELTAAQLQAEKWANIAADAEAEFRMRKPLTEDRIKELADVHLYNGGKDYGIVGFARAVESAHGIQS